MSVPPSHPSVRPAVRRRKRLVVTGVLSAGLLLAACSSNSSSPTTTSGGSSSTTAKTADPYLAADLKAGAAQLTGAGSTFVQPVFTKAFYAYSALNSAVTVNYQAVG